jgi:YVTN family beta-propeller protein
MRAVSQTKSRRQRTAEHTRGALGVALVVAVLAGCSPGGPAPPAAQPEPSPVVAPATSLRPVPTTTRPPGPATTATPAEAAPSRPSPQRRLRLAKTIAGNISPKSVVASGGGHVIAQNMMYRHTITVYDRSYRLVKTISDRVDLEALGGPAGGGPVRGAPVEAAFSPDGGYAYVSNYSMYGPGYTREGHDTCSPGMAIDRSFVYRLDMDRLAVDRVGRVGKVPKYVAATPDGRLVLVSNWCSYDLSVLAASTLKERKRIGLGAYPRGIAVDPRSRTAYVAVMGSTRIAVVDLRSFRVRWIEGVGAGPRHLVIDPAGRWLYVTLNGEGRVAKIDLRSRRVVARAATGSAPRSMTIAEDGRSLYVVNYNSATVSKLRARDLRVLQVVATNRHPIGIAYDVHDGAGHVWVACYSGTIKVFKDT